MTRWVMIVNIDKGMVKYRDIEYYEQFIGEAYPVIAEDHEKVILPIRPADGMVTITSWSKKEVRLATKEEIRKAELRMGAEKI